MFYEVFFNKNDSIAEMLLALQRSVDTGEMWVK